MSKRKPYNYLGHIFMNLSEWFPDEERKIKRVLRKLAREAALEAAEQAWIDNLSTLDAQKAQANRIAKALVP